MSFQVGSNCYNSASDALSAMAASMYGSSVQQDGTPISFYSISDASTVTTFSSTGTATTITPTLQQCSLVDVSDAGAYCAAVIACFLVAFKFKAMFTTVHANTSEDR